jgi:hypothetical protein
MERRVHLVLWLVMPRDELERVLQHALLLVLLQHVLQLVLLQPELQPVHQHVLQLVLLQHVLQLVLLQHVLHYVFQLVLQPVLRVILDALQQPDYLAKQLVQAQQPLPVHYLPFLHA